MYATRELANNRSIATTHHHSTSGYGSLPSQFHHRSSQQQHWSPINIGSRIEYSKQEKMLHDRLNGQRFLNGLNKRNNQRRPTTTTIITADPPPILSSSCAVAGSCPSNDDSSASPPHASRRRVDLSSVTAQVVDEMDRSPPASDSMICTRSTSIQSLGSDAPSPHCWPSTTCSTTAVSARLSPISPADLPDSPTMMMMSSRRSASPIVMKETPSVDDDNDDYGTFEPSAILDESILAAMPVRRISAQRARSDLLNEIIESAMPKLKLSPINTKLSAAPPLRSRHRNYSSSSTIQQDHVGCSSKTRKFLRQLLCVQMSDYRTVMSEG
jgi:hypothetical protein